jgi:hypothetical protein
MLMIALGLPLCFLVGTVMARQARDKVFDFTVATKVPLTFAKRQIVADE